MRFKMTGPNSLGGRCMKAFLGPSNQNVFLPKKENPWNRSGCATDRIERLLKRRVERIQFSDDQGLPTQAFVIGTCSIHLGPDQIDLALDFELNRHNSAPSGPRRSPLRSNQSKDSKVRRKFRRSIENALGRGFANPSALVISAGSRTAPNVFSISRSVNTSGNSPRRNGSLPATRSLHQ